MAQVASLSSNSNTTKKQIKERDMGRKRDREGLYVKIYLKFNKSRFLIKY
jgi:hypothetical protein